MITKICYYSYNVKNIKNYDFERESEAILSGTQSTVFVAQKHSLRFQLKGIENIDFRGLGKSKLVI